MSGLPQLSASVSLYRSSSSAVEGIVIGALAAATILYAFQTRVAYPTFVLRLLDHPWILFIAFILSLFSYKWSPQVAVFLVLMLTAFCIDTMVFARPLPQLLEETPAERLSHESAAKASPYDEKIVRRVPGVGVTATEAGVALSSVPLPEPLYPMFNAAISDIDNFAKFK